MQDDLDDVERNSLRFVVTAAKTSSIRGLLLRILDGGAGVAEPDAGYRYPEVAALNSTGQRRVLEVLDTEDEAQVGLPLSRTISGRCLLRSGAIATASHSRS